MYARKTGEEQFTYGQFLEMKIYKHGSLKLCPEIIRSDVSCRKLRDVVEDKLHSIFLFYSTGDDEKEKSNMSLKGWMRLGNDFGFSRLLPSHLVIWAYLNTCQRHPEIVSTTAMQPHTDDEFSISLYFEHFWSVLCATVSLLKTQTTLGDYSGNDSDNLNNLLRRMWRVTSWCGDSIMDATSTKIADYRLGLYRAGKPLGSIFEDSDESSIVNYAESK